MAGISSAPKKITAKKPKESAKTQVKVAEVAAENEVEVVDGPQLEQSKMRIRIAVAKRKVNK